MSIARLIFLLLLVSVFKISLAQDKVNNIDIICQTFLNENPIPNHTLFQKIIAQRKPNHLLTRLDTITADYVFIIETINSKSEAISIEEYYFIKEDTIPKKYYADSQFYSPKRIYRNTEFEYYFSLTRYWETLNPMLRKFDTLQPYQTLSYNPFIIISFGCVVFEEIEAMQAAEEKNKRIKELEKIYQILTLVDKVHHRTIVSFQIPPQTFNFIVRRYSPEGDF
ncbi:MAG: hypothetical protein PSX81_00970 [bacterium]|nr:hypothetical protein [bacterium]